MNYRDFSFRLPAWVNEYVARHSAVLTTMEERMRFVIGLSRMNVEKRTGGPFGAAVFDETGRLVTPGVNLVESVGCSILHAEMVAIALAQKRLNRFDIGNGGAERFALYASTEPCAMCFGAVPWSGVSELVCGARDEDARRIGFDEGPKLSDWTGALESRGITVTTDVLRVEASRVLNDYVRDGGTIYNSGKTCE